jgi:glycosyltransferase involved in cell wall biosynthesis
MTDPQTPTSKPTITVAICTYRRAGLLPTTLASLAAVDRPTAGWDLVIVDNGCEDAVARVVEQFRDRLPIRYEREPEVGIARARNRAVNCATGPLILFADDDVLFDPHWLTAMLRAIAEHPECDFWGGRIEPIWEVARPAWFDVERCPSLGDSVVKYDVGAEARYWNPDRDPPFYTANLALRTEAVQRMGMFDVTLGHSGTKRGSGEDSWMIKSISRAGGRGWYAADAVLHHPVEAKRLTRPYARRFAWRQGKVSVEMLRRESAPPGQTHGPLPRWLYRVAAAQVFRGGGQWLGGTFRGHPGAGAAFAGQYAALFNFSKLWHAVGRRP